MTSHRSDIAYAWWRSLQPDSARHFPGDRAALATLRRAATPAEAALERASVDLARKLGTNFDGYETVALAAGVLAHVRKDTGRSSLARSIGVQEDKTTLVSWLRVRRLLQADTPEERMTGFRRLVNQLGNEVPFHDLADCLLDWSELRRRRFVYDFHAAPIPAAPEISQPLQEPSP